MPEVVSIPILPVGEYKPDARFINGKQSINLSEARLSTIRDNFNEGVLKTGVQLDEDHKRGEAFGWLVPGSARLGSFKHPKTGSPVSGLIVDAELTPEGEKARAEKRFRYVSADVNDYRDEETGVVHHNVLRAVALTNKPVLKLLPGIGEAETADAIAASEGGFLFAETYGEVADEYEQMEATYEADPRVHDAAWEVLSALKNRLMKPLTTLTGSALRDAIQELVDELPDLLPKAIEHEMAEDRETEEAEEAVAMSEDSPDESGESEDEPAPTDSSEGGTRMAEDTIQLSEAQFAEYEALKQERADALTARFAETAGRFDNATRDKLLAIVAADDTGAIQLSEDGEALTLAEALIEALSEATVPHSADVREEKTPENEAAKFSEVDERIHDSLRLTQEEIERAKELRASND